jgi:phosphoglycerol transferase MdoB-like AlkP superfamily enzyme
MGLISVLVYVMLYILGLRYVWGWNEMIFQPFIFYIIYLILFNCRHNWQNNEINKT